VCLSSTPGMTCSANGLAWPSLNASTRTVLRPALEATLNALRICKMHAKGQAQGLRFGKLKAGTQGLLHLAYSYEGTASFFVLQASNCNAIAQQPWKAPRILISHTYPPPALHATGCQFECIGGGRKACHQPPVCTECESVHAWPHKQLHIALQASAL